jgi:hypothetical protein
MSFLRVRRAAQEELLEGDVVLPLLVEAHRDPAAVITGLLTPPAPVTIALRPLRSINSVTRLSTTWVGGRSSPRARPRCGHRKVLSPQCERCEAANGETHHRD